jgi:putative SOS response-associated peptidase YedK
MCGRYVSTSSPQQLADVFGATIDVDPLTPSYNVAPTNDVYAVVRDTQSPAPVVRSFRWGLVPVWAKDARIGSKMINARAETLTEKPAFKTLFRSRRLLVPMDGFYEWQAVPGSKVKQPLFLHRPDRQILVAAGLWAAWRDPAEGPDGPWLHSLTIITTAANEMVSAIHDRMPVFLSTEHWDEWLDPANRDTESLSTLLMPAPESLLTADQVSTAVNNVRNKGPELIETMSS